MGARRSFGYVRQLPSGRWQASYNAPGGVRMRAPITFDREADADAWLATERADLLRRTWRAPAPASREQLGDWMTAWLGDRRDLSPRTRQLYASLLRLHIAPTIGRARMCDLSPADVRAWLGDLTTGPTARAQAYRLLRTACNAAVAEGAMDSNPCQVAGAGVARAAERVPPTLADVAALADHMPPRYRLLVLVAAWGGLRRGELAGLIRADVTLPADGDGPARLRVERSLQEVDGRLLVCPPKTEAGRRTVTLPAFLTPLLRAHLADFVGDSPAAVLFATSTGRPFSGHNLTATVHKACARAGIAPIRFHDLRHLGATLAAQAGATPRDIMGRIGHASPAAAQIYQHTAASRDELIAQALHEAHEAMESGKVVPLRKAQ